MDGRRVTTLQGLLKFAIEQGQCQDSGGGTYDEMDHERKAFLENAFKSMTIDVMEELSQAISVLEDNSTSNAQKSNALNLIRDHIDNIDFANSFVKLGGTNILIECLKSHDKNVRIAAINIVAEMSQNNAFCQKHFLEHNILKLLITYLNDNEDLVSSSLYAISALVRGFEPGAAELIEIGGLELVVNCLNTSFTRAFIKACFLISTLSTEYMLVRDEFVKLGAFEKLANFLEVITDFDVKMEALLRAMAELSQSKKFKPDEELKGHIIKTLHDIISQNEKLPQCEEIVEYSNTLLDKLI
uniref:Nucleotide exchange factor Fes1 domain-containing protein n=1 Tax=Glossina palpalis gambiensis TaxID=67801 RepID=A0A1B0BYY6_9MUSC